MEELTNEQISRELAPYLADVHLEPPFLAARGFDQIRAYIRLLLKWNRSMSLTSVTDPKEIVRYHFGESILAASLVEFQNGRLADFGSGAGFPGLPIRMAVSTVNVTLVESNLRKCAFLSEVVRELGLSHVGIEKFRVEDLDGQGQPFDFVTARAFGHFDLLLGAARRALTETGRTILWLGEKDCRNLMRRTDWKWLAPAHIPNSERRFILMGSPAS